MGSAAWSAPTGSDSPALSTTPAWKCCPTALRRCRQPRGARSAGPAPLPLARVSGPRRQRQPIRRPVLRLSALHSRLPWMTPQGEPEGPEVVGSRGKKTRRAAQGTVGGRETPLVYYQLAQVSTLGRRHRQDWRSASRRCARAGPPEPRLPRNADAASQAPIISYGRRCGGDGHLARPCVQAGRGVVEGGVFQRS